LPWVRKSAWQSGRLALSLCLRLCTIIAFLPCFRNYTRQICLLCARYMTHGKGALQCAAHCHVILKRWIFLIGSGNIVEAQIELEGKFGVCTRANGCSLVLPNCRGFYGPAGHMEWPTYA
jgi:hypothetical protein